MGSSALAVVRKFHHTPTSPVVTSFNGDKISTSPDCLTLVVRTDAAFATRSVARAFKAEASTVCSPGHPSNVTDLISKAYQSWGSKVMEALVNAIDYKTVYGLSEEESNRAHVHFHSADSLAGRVIRKAASFIDSQHPNSPEPVYISLDDMIHEGVFDQYANRGRFAEIGFSRLFSLAGEEVGYVGRPGKGNIEDQVKKVSALIDQVGKGHKAKVPVVLLEDNVRKAKTLLWFFDRLQEYGVMDKCEIVGVATCFSVATPKEQMEIRCGGPQIPLLVGVDYTDSLVDVVTPRDHLFDGFVVRRDNKLGRLPSFLLSIENMAEQFKLKLSATSEFMSRIYLANMEFCSDVKQSTNIEPKVNSFVSGPVVSSLCNVKPDTPMVEVLRKVHNGHYPELRSI